MKKMRLNGKNSCWLYLYFLNVVTFETPLNRFSGMSLDTLHSCFLRYHHKTGFYLSCINKAWQLSTAQAFLFGKLVCSKLIS